MSLLHQNQIDSILQLYSVKQEYGTFLLLKAALQNLFQLTASSKSKVKDFLVYAKVKIFFHLGQRFFTGNKFCLKKIHTFTYYNRNL